MSWTNTILSAQDGQAASAALSERIMMVRRTQAVNETTGELALPVSVSQAVWQDITTYADAEALFDGFIDEIYSDVILKRDDKDKLVGVPFLIVGWAFRPGDFGEFVAAKIITENNFKAVLLDGSTGIAAQIRAYEQSHPGRTGGLRAAHGLSKSEYFFNEDTHDIVRSLSELPPGADPKAWKPAATFYLS